MRTWEDVHAHLFTHAILDDVISKSELTTQPNSKAHCLNKSVIWLSVIQILNSFK